MPIPFIVIRYQPISIGQRYKPPRVAGRWLWVCLACSLAGSTYYGGTMSFQHTMRNVQRHLFVRRYVHRHVLTNEEHCNAIESTYERKRNGV